MSVKPTASYITTGEKKLIKNQDGERDLHTPPVAIKMASAVVSGVFSVFETALVIITAVFTVVLHEFISRIRSLLGSPSGWC